jgi:hypothetical protein
MSIDASLKKKMISEKSSSVKLTLHMWGTVVIDDSGVVFDADSNEVTFEIVE